MRALVARHAPALLRGAVTADGEQAPELAGTPDDAVPRCMDHGLGGIAVLRGFTVLFGRLSAARRGAARRGHATDPTGSAGDRLGVTRGRTGQDTLWEARHGEASGECDRQGSGGGPAGYRILRSAAGLLLASLVSLLIASCGGSGGAANSAAAVPEANVTGTVVLPGGSSLSPAALKVVSAEGESTVTGSGGFVLRAPDAAIQNLSVESTAQAVLFYALGGFTLPPDLQRDLLQRIAGDTRFPALV